MTNVTEQQWIECTDPRPMLEFLLSKDTYDIEVARIKVLIFVDNEQVESASLKVVMDSFDGAE